MERHRKTHIMTATSTYHAFLHFTYCFVLRIMRNIWQTVEEFVYTMASVCSHHRTPVRTSYRFTVESEGEIIGRSVALITPYVAARISPSSQAIKGTEFCRDIYYEWTADPHCFTQIAEKRARSTDLYRFIQALSSCSNEGFRFLGYLPYRICAIHISVES
jgi:hypothetical protein